MSEYKLGELAEGMPWAIVENVETSQWSALCKHCTPLVATDIKRHDGSIYQRWDGTCKLAVVAHNEGGCNQTEVCLECILDAAAALGIGAKNV